MLTIEKLIFFDFINDNLRIFSNLIIVSKLVSLNFISAASSSFHQDFIIIYELILSKLNFSIVSNKIEKRKQISQLLSVMIFINFSIVSIEMKKMQ